MRIAHLPAGGGCVFSSPLFVLPSYHSNTKFMANFLKTRKIEQRNNEHVMSSYTYVLEVKSWILRVYISFLEYDHTYILKGWASQKPIYPCCCCEGDDHRCHIIIFMGWSRAMFYLSVFCEAQNCLSSLTATSKKFFEYL